MAAPILRPATYQDILDLPTHKRGEILNGELVVSPHPAPKHINTSSVLGSDLVRRFHRRKGGRGRPGGWWILDEPEVHLGANVLVPDLAGWRRKRMPSLPEEAYFTLAPDWVCEILSPSSMRLDRGEKKALYAQEGVLFLWLVEPEAQLIEAYEIRESRWLEIATFYGKTHARIPPFDAVELDLASWWGEE